MLVLIVIIAVICCNCKIIIYTVINLLSDKIISKIKKELLTRECSSNKERVRRLFLESYSYGETITGANVKTKLQEIYGRLSLRIAATAKQIESYFSVRHKTIRVQGVSTRVYILVETLFPES